MQAGDPLAGHREHAERVVLPQLGLGGEREAGQVGQLAQVARMRAGVVERAAVVRHVVVRVAQRVAQPVQLQGAQLVHADPLDGIQLVRTRGAVLHGYLLARRAPDAGR